MVTKLNANQYIQELVGQFEEKLFLKFEERNQNVNEWAELIDRIESHE